MKSREIRSKVTVDRSTFGLCMFAVMTLLKAELILLSEPTKRSVQLLRRKG